MSWFVFFTILPFSIYSILLAIVPIRIQQVSRTLSKEAVERGDTIEVTVRFHNKSWFPLVFMTARETAMDADFYEELNGNATKLFLVGWKKEFEWTYELRDLRRGEHHFKGIEVMCTDFFGWTVRQVVIEHPQLFLVYPKIYDVKTEQITMQYDQGASQTRFSLIKDTTMATGVREYVPGDRFSWIHWKSFAKNGELRTKEFEDRNAQNTFVLIDRAVQKNFEQVVEFAASYIQKTMKARGDVSFLSVGTDRYFAPVIKTDSQFKKIMQHFVTVQADAEFGVERLLFEEQKVMSRSVVIIITGEWLPELQEALNASTKSMGKIVCFVVNNEAEPVHLKNQNEVHIIKEPAQLQSEVESL
ncbi:DUF58 domain-containing protein [Solibacillus sp. FSL R7-0668]|uniref:DUF58 domain-containing protein n=1 Tax=Solibacillus sp. FSL R7-0668 TaxID=2921688 RepID=UPI0030F77FB8